MKNLIKRAKAKHHKELIDESNMVHAYYSLQTRSGIDMYYRIDGDTRYLYITLRGRYIIKNRRYATYLPFYYFDYEVRLFDELDKYCLTTEYLLL